MARNSAKTPLLLAGWLVACAFLNCTGWLLSAAHQLNALGYTAAFLAAAVAVFLLRRQGLFPPRRPVRFDRLRRRFSRAYPAAFLVLALLAFLGGLLYPPTNYDGLAYREPRVLHWLAEGQWHWIHTDFQRLNVRACGFEWLFAPLFVFTKTDRAAFLINLASFLLLPGLIFGVFTRLGLRPRTAWHWMWLLPSGYCFVLQAGSIANDAFSAVFALGAVDLALRARATRSVGQVWLSCLAAALLTGSKPTNLPLLLPWAIAILPSLSSLWKRPAASLAVGVVAVTCSFAPVAALNVKHCGDWSGQAAEQAFYRPGQPVLHVTQNAALLAALNLVPPAFPMVAGWERLMHKVISPERARKLADIFEPGAVYLTVPDMQTEESAGLGFGLSLLLLATLAATTFSSRPAGNRTVPLTARAFRAAILTAPWISVLPLLVVSGATTPARYLAPHYCLLVPVFLLGQSGDWIMRHHWWRLAGILVFLLAGILVIVSPARPLWPAQLLLSHLPAGSVPALKRAETVYAVYAKRADAFAPVLESVPRDTTVLGLVTFDDPETSLWRPFGSRRIRHVTPEDTRESLQAVGVDYVLVGSEHFSQHFNVPLEQWLAGINAGLVRTIPLTLRARKSAADWYLVKLRPADAASTPAPRQP